MNIAGVWSETKSNQRMVNALHRVAQERWKFVHAKDAHRCTPRASGPRTRIVVDDDLKCSVPIRSERQRGTVEAYEIRGSVVVGDMERIHLGARVRTEGFEQHIRAGPLKAWLPLKAAGTASFEGRRIFP